MQPLISIVTTLYNYAHFVGQLAATVLDQTWQNWEWIIVDDGSTDNPVSVLGPLLKSELVGRKVHYLQFKTNRGYSAAKNFGITHSRGECIRMIDADDMLTPKSLELLYNGLKDSGKLWIHGEVKVKNGDSLSDESRKWKRNFRAKLTKEGWDLTKTYHHRLVHAQSVMVTRELHKKYGLYDESLRFSSDNEMWRRIIRFGEVPAHIEDHVALYRVHPDRMSRSAYKKVRCRAVKKQIIQDVERRFKEGIEETLAWR